MNYRLLLILFLPLLALSFLFEWHSSPVAYSMRENFTVPTKTPRAPTPEPTTGGGGGGGADPTAVPATATAKGPTAVPTAIVIAPTPIGGFLPTAEPCDVDPTVFALAATNVREGPGLQYDVVAVLVYLEVRPIIGRSGSIPFWQLELSDGRKGWVDAMVVSTQGNTSVIPIVSAPILDGATVTPGPRWNPPLPPGCDILATRTAVPEQTATATTTPAVTPGQLVTPSDNSEVRGPASSEAAATPDASVQLETTALAPPTAASVNNPTSDAEPLVLAQPTTSSTDIFLIGVGVLVLIGGGFTLFRLLQKG